MKLRPNMLNFGSSSFPVINQFMQSAAADDIIILRHFL